MDWTRIDQLKDEVGEDSLAEVLMMFLEETDEVVERLKGPVPEDALESEIHFLKGAALNIGFDSVAKLCQVAETAAANGQGATVDLPTIVDYYTAARAKLWARADEFGLVA